MTKVNDVNKKVDHQKTKKCLKSSIMLEFALKQFPAIFLKAGLLDCGPDRRTAVRTAVRCPPLDFPHDSREFSRISKDFSRSPASIFAIKMRYF